MKLIAHRKNTIEELISTPQEYGVEIDIRSYGSELVLHHDPFIKGELFYDWLDNFNHGTLILNTKEEGLESSVIDLLKLRNIDDYFFLDQSFPFLIKWSKIGEHRCAVRVSEYESISTALSLAGKISWVWVDFFSNFPLSKNDYLLLMQSGFKICLVSPELQGRTDEKEIHEFFLILNNLNIIPDAVCTKRPEIWKLFKNE